MNALHSLVVDAPALGWIVHKPHPVGLIRRRPRIELLESRIALSADPAAASAAMQNAAASSAAGADAAAGPTEFRQAAAAPSSAGNQPGNQRTAADLLFDPHQPKSGLPADVTSGIGPPSQQGAPPRFSYNLEDNITGADHSDQEALLGPLHAPDSPVNSAGAGVPPNVANTPFGMPNFSFGPDTWVFGPQTAGPPEARTARRPIRPTDSEISPDLQNRDLQNSAPSDEPPTDSAPDGDRGAWSPQQRPIARPAPQPASPPSKMPGVGEAGPRLGALESGPASRPALEGKAVDRLIADDASLREFDAPPPQPWPAASPIGEPDSDRSDLFIPAALATSLVAPAASRDPSGLMRNPPGDRRGGSRPVRRLRG
jgi:hypothetical protein